jgi:multidrug efflux system membrane fusion protein
MIKSNKLLIFLLSMAFISFMNPSCKTSEEEVRKTEIIPTVDYFIAGTRKISLPVSSPGILASKTQSNLSFMTGGIIDKVYVSEGEIVEKGQLLARLDLTEIDSRVAQARLGMEKASRDFRRAENLYADSVATLEQFENARTAFDLAESNMKIATFNKQYSEIHSPGKGKILKQLQEENEIVAPGYPVFIFASTEADWVLRLNLADRDFVKINMGDSANIVFDAFPGKEFPGIVTEIATASNPLNGTYEVEMGLSKMPDQLVSGLIGKVKIFPHPASEIIIPANVLAGATGKEGFVYKISGDRVERKSILIKEVFSEGIAVSEGIEAGDSLVSSGRQWIRSGDRVRLGKIK